MYEAGLKQMYLYALSLYLWGKHNTEEPEWMQAQK